MAQSIKEAAQTKATEVAAPGKSLTIFDQVMRNEASVAKALPGHVPVGPFIRQVLTSLRTNPKLAECTWQSVIGGMMLGAQLGLELNSPKGHAYLIPFRNKNTGQMEATFILGYKGIIRLAQQSGELKNIEARTVYANDEFDYSYGLEGTLYHKPTLGDPGPAICYYGLAKFTNGGHYYVVMSPHEIGQHRARSLSKNGGPWVTDFDSMAKKTTIRVMQPYLPLSTELLARFGADEEVVRFDGNTLEAQAVEMDALGEAQPVETVPADSSDELRGDPETGEVIPVEAVEAPSPELASGGQVQLVGIRFDELEIAKPADRLAEIAKIIGHTLKEISDLTKAEASKVIDVLTERYQRS